MAILSRFSRVGQLEDGGDDGRERGGYGRKRRFLLAFYVVLPLSALDDVSGRSFNTNALQLLGESCICSYLETT